MHEKTVIFPDITDDHLLNATYYSPELENRQMFDHHMTNLGSSSSSRMVQNESPVHIDTASSAGIIFI